MKNKPTLLLIIVIISLIIVNILLIKNLNREKLNMKNNSFDAVFQKGEINPYGKYFTGQTYPKLLVEKDDVFNSSIANVTFEPGARTN